MIDFLKALINIPSISGHEADVCQFLHNFMLSRGYRVQTQAVEGDRFNILASPAGKTRVLLCTHVDTVAPFIPFLQQGDLVYGRGACDAKGQIVCMFEALERLCAAGIDDVGLLLVVGEETTSIGAKIAAKHNLGAKYVVVGEPTDNKLAIGQKGVLVYKLTAYGTGGHSSLPELGESAVHTLLDVLHTWLHTDWGEDPVLGKSLVNVGLFNGGVGMNVLAPHATAEGIFRVSTSLAAIYEKIEAALPPDVQFESKSETEPQRLTSIPGLATTVVGFGTDAGHLRPLGDIVLYGPGSITTAHGDNEQVSLRDMERAVDDYVRIVKYLLK